MAVEPIVRERFGSDDGNMPDGDNPNLFPEDELDLPWAINSQVSWLEYRCWVEVDLDAGMVLHKPLPQSNYPIDTISSVFFTDVGNDPDYATSKDGLNVSSASPAVDIIQRMSSSTYFFVLRGWALRAGYQIPIPGLRSVGGVPAVPYGRQWGYNTIISNFSGIPTWFATWEIHYVVPQSPRTNAKAPVPPNPALVIKPSATLPLAIALPRAFPDERATQQSILRPSITLPGRK